MASEKVYRSFIGIVQFDPREGQAGGKAVRNITIRNAGVKENSMRVSATLWPSHAHVAVEKGDVVFIEGSFERNTKTNSETGEKVVYNNVSVSAIKNFGPADTGQEIEREDAAEPAEDADDDDIPF